MDKLLSAVAKLLLWPRTLTIFDLELLSNHIGSGIQKLLEGECESDDLVSLSLTLLRPLATPSKPYGFTIHKESLEKRFLVQKRLIRRLIEENHAELAEMYAYVVIRMIFYLLTLYTISAGIQRIVPEPLKIKFEQGSLRTLVEMCKDSEFLETLGKLNLDKDLEFTLKSFIQMIKTTKNLLPEEAQRRLSSEIGEFFEEYVDINTIHTTIQELLRSDLPEHIKRRIVESAIYIVSILVREKVIGGEAVIENLTKLLRTVRKLTESITPQYRDILWDILSQLTDIIAEVHSGNTESAIQQLTELGRRILYEKYMSITMSERILMKTSNDTKSLIPPLVIAPMNLADTYQYVSISQIINEAIDSIINASSELRVFLNTLAVLSTEQITKFILSAQKEPLAGLALDFIVGSISAWLIDLIINYLAPKSKARKEIIEKILDILILYLSEILKKTKKLLESWSKPKYLRRFVGYHIYREYYFLSMRLTVVEDIKKDIPKAQQLLDLIEEISNLLESIYGPTKPKKEELTEEFIV